MGCAFFGKKVCDLATLTLCSDSDFSAVLENKGYFAVSVDNCFLNHYRPDGGIPVVQYLAAAQAGHQLRLEEGTPHLALLYYC